MRRKTTKRKRMPAQGPAGRAFISSSCSAGTKLLSVSMYPKAQPTDAPPACRNTRADPLKPRDTKAKLPVFRNLRQCSWFISIYFLYSWPSSEKRWKEGSAHRNCSPALKEPGRNWRRHRHSSCISLAALSSQSSVSGNIVGQDVYFLVQILI